MTPAALHQDTASDSSSLYSNNAATSSDLEKIERRRALTRTRQLRYLQKKRQYENDLRASVARLRTEVQQLQQCLHELQFMKSTPPSLPLLGGSSRINVLQTAQSFIRGFHSNFSLTEETEWLPCGSSNQDQIRFIQQSIHPDIRHGKLHGQSAFLEQWRRYTAFFGFLALTPNSFELVSHGDEPESMCRVDLTMSLGLVSATFWNVFPHLLQPQHAGLLDRLMNQQIHVPMTLLLQFDDENRVVHYDQSLNFVKALHSLLYNYEDVAVVLQNAHVFLCGHIGSDITSPRDVRHALSFLLTNNVD